MRITRAALLIVYCLLTVAGIRAQSTGTISGSITSEEGDLVNNVLISVVDGNEKSRTDKNGYFFISIPADSVITLAIKHPSYRETFRTVKVANGETFELNITLYIRELGGVIVEDSYSGGMESVKPLGTGFIPTPNQSVEDLIKVVGLGVSSNNELSSSYSVRGGNYDENLIYVNDIEIYRPFLVRSGQQEGLSFIHTDLVREIQFSAGGFEARYGDKMSSVLDIKYRRPKDFGGTFTGSLLGGSLHMEGTGKKRRFTWLMGARYRANNYVLGALQTTGEYRPVFADVQTLMAYEINMNWRVEVLAHYSSNNYRFVPQTRETSFGTINEALKLTVYFDGQENNRFRTFMGATSFTYEPSDKTVMKFIASGFRSQEEERFDVQGEYFIGDVDNDLGSDDFGEVTFNRGVGTYLDHARNQLDATVLNVYHKGQHQQENHLFHWGGRAQYEYIFDELSEWQMIDSAGFSIPQAPSDEIQLSEVIKSKAQLESGRFMAYGQYTYTQAFLDTIERFDTAFASNLILNASIGARANYWTLNNEVVFSPRARISIRPRWYVMHNDTLRRRDAEIRLSGGYYYQPPFYRELRSFDGSLNREIRAQRSIHAVLGGDFSFYLWDRVFKYTAEVYYKDLGNLIPYEIDNVRIRYYAENSARGYAAGLDMKLHGEFIRGVESWVRMSVMQTNEDVLNDFYYDYLNSAGETIIPGVTEDDIIVDSARVEPGSIPRPTDQRFTFGLFFQDNMPGLEALKVQLSFIFGTSLPYGPPSFERYRDTLRTPSYRRVDLGLSYDFLSNKENLREGSPLKNLDMVLLSLEVFNLLNINNTVSYTWITDVSGLQYAIPNFLTARRVNLKLSVRF